MVGNGSKSKVKIEGLKGDIWGSSAVDSVIFLDRYTGYVYSRAGWPLATSIYLEYDTVDRIKRAQKAPNRPIMHVKLQASRLRRKSSACLRSARDCPRGVGSSDRRFKISTPSPLIFLL